MDDGVAHFLPRKYLIGHRGVKTITLAKKTLLVQIRLQRRLRRMGLENGVGQRISSFLCYLLVVDTYCRLGRELPPVVAYF